MPSKDDALTVSSEAPPRECAKALRWWAKHLDAVQDDVAEAMWKRFDSVNWLEPETSGPNASSAPVRPRGRRARQHAGRLYRIEDGELTSVDSDGVVRFHGCGIWLAFAGDDGLLVIASDVDGQNGVWRMPSDPRGTSTHLAKGPFQTDGTYRVVDAATGGVPDAVLLIGYYTRCFLKETAKTSDGRLFPHDKVSESGIWGAFSMRHDGPGRILVVLRLLRASDNSAATSMCDVWSLDTASGATRSLALYKNTTSACAGPAGVYTTTEKGLLQRAAAAPWSVQTLDASKKWSAVIGVATDVIWATLATGELACVAAKSGIVKHTTKFDPDASWSLDRVTGDLVRATKDGYERLRAADGKIEALPPAR